MAAMSANPEMTTFSYAQAAKGVHAAPQPAKAASTDSSKTVPQPDEQNTDSSPQTNADAVPAETETTRDAEKTPASADKDSELTPTKPNVSGTSSPSVGTTSTSATGKDDGASTPNGTSESTWDKQSQASATEKPSNGTETEGTKGKSNPTSEKAPPKELKAAPLPTVNIWQQRKEAQDAKAKAIAALKPAGTGASKTASAAPSVSGDNAQEQPKTASKKKGVDGVPEGGKDRKRTDGRKGRDEGKRIPQRTLGFVSQRQVEANMDCTGASIPPVEDAALWPTPQVAQGEEKRKAQEKSEKGDKSPVIRPHGKEKWMPVPYVPTAVFSTPLPSSGRRGGRAARGGRDGARSGTHGAGSSPDKSSAQGSLSKQAVDRGRGEQNAARANSLPAQSRRSDSADVAKSGDPRKNSQPADRSRGAKGEDAAGRPTYGSETFPRQAKPFSRNHEFGMNKGDNRNLRLADGGSRSGDRRFENGPKSADFAGFQGDHKDRDYHRDSRADRGRGSHRGRGGHAGYGSQNSQFGNAHMPHSPFVHPKSFGFNDRQRSQGVPNGSQQGPRMPLRSPSLPNSAAMYGVYPFSADINPMYGYPPMHPGTMSAVPYQPYMEPFSVMSMLSMQL